HALQHRGPLRARRRMAMRRKPSPELPLKGLRLRPSRGFQKPTPTSLNANFPLSIPLPAVSYPHAPVASTPVLQGQYTSLSSGVAAESEHRFANRGGVVGEAGGLSHAEEMV